jgi:PleD family two-component response regulator
MRLQFLFFQIGFMFLAKGSSPQSLSLIEECSQRSRIFVSFLLAVPPAKPIIYDAKRRDMSKLLEAYPEGADLFLVCEVHGGKCRLRICNILLSRRGSAVKMSNIQSRLHLGATHPQR